MSTIKRAVVFPDQHFPLHYEPAFRAALKTIEVVKPDIFVNLGDVGEWESVSHWKWKRRRKPPLRYIIPEIDEDMFDVNAQLDRIDKRLDDVGCDERYLIQGNHDEWLDRFIEDQGIAALNKYQFHNAVRAEERGYDYYPLGEMLNIGKLYFYHGHFYGNKYHTAKHLRELGVNVIYGDRHSIQMHSLAQVDKPIAAWCVGCLKDLSREANKFTRGRPNNWAHAVTVVDFFENGNFSVNLKNIIDGKTTVDGVEIDGNA